MNRKFKKLDPNTTEEELIRLVNEGRIYMYEEDYERMLAEMQHPKNKK